MARRQTNRETKKKLDDLAASWERLCEELTEIEKRKASSEAPSKKWSALKYVFWHQGGPICRGRSTSLKRLSRS